MYFNVNARKTYHVFHVSLLTYRWTNFKSIRKLSDLEPLRVEKKDISSCSKKYLRGHPFKRLDVTRLSVDGLQNFAGPESKK